MLKLALQRLVSCILLLAVVVGFTVAQEQSVDAEYDRLIRTFVAQNTANSIVLADANLITLGVMDFDPNEFADFGDLNVGSEESLELRKSLKTYSLPWSFKPTKLSDNLETQYRIRLSYVGAKQDLVYADPQYVNALDEETYLLFGEKAWRYQLSKNWRIELGLAAQYVYYRNHIDYQDPILILFREIFDQQILNTSYSAVLFDPMLNARYQGEIFGHRFEYTAQYRHALGHTLTTDSHNQKTGINTGRLTNTLALHYDTPDIRGRASQFRLLARRIDIDHDAVSPMGASHYYEFGVGWLVDTSNDFDWIDNIGLGVSLNAGSNLSGGSVVILFNEEM